MTMLDRPSMTPIRFQTPDIFGIKILMFERVLQYFPLPELKNRQHHEIQRIKKY